MNKSLVTNLVALIALAVGYAMDNQVILYAGLFAFSGAITNALAIHMLFEKVPGLYGSGVILDRFESIKLSIKDLMMAQFFTAENIQNFLQGKTPPLDENAKQNDALAPMTISDVAANQAQETQHSPDEKSHAAPAFDFTPVMDQIDFNQTYDSLVDVINNSQFGGMLAMFGGSEALEPLKAPFIEKIKANMLELSHKPSVQQAIQAQLAGEAVSDKLEQKIEQMIEARLNELTPQMVKEMVQKMIKAHLGWLVVWGGVFGGLIGVLSALIAS